MIKKPSKYQIDIFEAYRNTSKNLVINATAGSGKTSTIVELLNQTPKHLRTILLAFNKSIAEEIKTRVPSNIEVKTVHSLGCGLLYKHYPYKLKVTEFKNYSLAKKTMKFSHIKKDKEGLYIFNLSKIIDAYKLNLFEEKEQLKEYLDYSGFPVLNGKDIDDAWFLLNKVNEYNNHKDHDEFMIDFTDMLYLPIKEKIDFPKYDVVYIDECQDVSILQKKLIDNVIKRNGRFVSVGDDRQLLYAFIGANIKSFNEFKNAPNTLNLPLSVSYRCSKKVVEYANTIFPNSIEPSENAEEGEVIMDGKLYDAKDGDFVLCRNNLPLVEAYIFFLLQKKKAYIYGKELGKHLQLLTSKFIDLQDDYVETEMDNYLQAVKDDLLSKGVVNPINHNKYIVAQENITILKLLINRFKNIREVNNHLEEMFSDDTNKGIILSTIHKSKGLEANNVFAYKYFELIPSKYAKTKEDLYAEQCLKFVCVTRAKKKLIFVN